MKEVYAAFRAWLRERDKRKTVKNKIVDVDSDLGQQLKIGSRSGQERSALHDTV
jgi:hypothetical protein